MSETAYLFVDTFAFEKLALQPECRVGQRGARMAGYETYLIEQWACERRVNTVVAAYTGNSQHIVDVQVLLVPTDLGCWSPITRAHFEELVRMHILPKKTPLGNMLVTSLSSLPSNLTLVSIPSRFRTGIAGFVANENLRKLQVAGRAAVTAAPPSDSVLATFRRVYGTSSSVSGSYAVTELVTLMQIALVYFGLLNPQNVDGLLCENTNRAISVWWSSFGKQRFKDVVPREQDKLYMRTSCCALIGVVMGARQRMSALGLKPPKDPFDAESFVSCIKRFQKLERLPRTLQLDDTTYFKLVQETAKLGSRSATGNVLTAMKSTVKEGLSGKVTEALADWETLDLELLAKNVRGERARYLWHGRGEPLVPHIGSDIPKDIVGRVSRIPLFSLIPDEGTVPMTPISSAASTAPVSAQSTAPNSTNVSRRGSYLNLQPLHTATDVEYTNKTNFSNWKWHSAEDTAKGVHGTAHDGEDHASVDNTGDEETRDTFDRNQPTMEQQHRYQQPNFPDVLVSKLLVKDDSAIRESPDVSQEAAKLRRTASLSGVESTLFSWDSLVPLPGLLKLYERAKELQAELAQRMRLDLEVSDNMADHTHDVELQLAEVQRESVLIKYHIHASTKKEESVRRRVRELEAFMARIDYEMATLTVKLRDVDQSVMAFAAKVDAAENRWKLIKKSQKQKKQRWF